MPYLANPHVPLECAQLLSVGANDTIDLCYWTIYCKKLWKSGNHSGACVGDEEVGDVKSTKTRITYIMLFSYATFSSMHANGRRVLSNAVFESKEKDI